MNDKIKDVEIRQATAEDMRLFYPNGSPKTSYSWIAYYKGQPACIAGLVVERGGCTAYSEIKDGIDAPKLTIWRTARAIMANIKALGLPMFAVCDECNKSSHEFVKRLGFTYVQPYDGKEMFVCR